MANQENWQVGQQSMMMGHGVQEGGTLVEGSGPLGVECSVQEIIINK